MKHPMILVAILALAPLAAFCAPAGAGDGAAFLRPGSPVESRLGVNIHFTSPREGEMKSLAAAGFRWIRMDFNWGSTERIQGQYDFSAYDKLLAALEPQGIRALLILDYSNKLYDQGLSPYTPAGRAGFARWAAAAARHFKGRGILWEMYNEPNIGFWKPSPKADDYIALARETGQALREAAPEELYCGPATSGMDLAFLEKCFQAGLLDYWCAVTVHPYRQEAPETVGDDYRQLRVLIQRYAPPGRQIPILSGEWGYSSAWKHYDQDRQGRYLPRQWLVNCSQDIPLSIWYDWHDDGTKADDSEHHFGTVLHPYRQGQDPVYEPKPAYLAAKTLAAQLQGFRFNKRLSLPDSQDWLLIFTREQEIRLAAWTTSKTPRQVRLPFRGGKFAVTGHLGQPAAALEATAEGLPITLTEEVQYLAPDQPDEVLRCAVAWLRTPLEHLASGAAPQVDLKTTFVNPLDRKVPTALSWQVEKRPAFRLPGNPHEVVPHGMTTLSGTAAVTREDLCRPVRFELSIPGLPTLAQESAICQSEPLRLNFLPVSRAGLPVQIANPAGTAFQGTLELQNLQGLTLPARTQAVAWKKGVREKTVVFALPEGQLPNQEYQVGARLLDRNGQEILVAGPSRFLPLPGFLLAPGQAPEQWVTPCQALADGDAKVKSEQALATAVPPVAPPVPGWGVLKFTYSCDGGWKFFRLALKPGVRRELPGQPKALSLWVYGDGKGLGTRLRFRDAAGQIFQPAAESITFQGWKYLTFRLAGTGLEHWGGPNDGEIRYPLSLDTLFILDNVSHAPVQGEIFLQAPVLVY